MGERKCSSLMIRSEFFSEPVPLDWRRQWQPTPVLLPGKSHGWRSLVGYNLWGREETDTTEQLHFLLILNCMSCLYILEIKHLLVASFANIFSHSEIRLFILFIVSFTVLKRLSLIRSHCVESKQ